MQEIDVRARTTASAQTVYALLAEGATWPTWSPIGSFRLESPASDGGEGVGAVRLFQTGRTRSHEEIVELVPGRRLSYTLRHGLPLRGYRADVDLTEGPEGTDIRWHSTFRPAIPGTGWFFRTFLGSFIQRCADGLAAYAADPARLSAGRTETP